MPLNLDNLKGKSLFVATPMYGNQCFGSFMESCMKLQSLCAENEIPFNFFALYNESLVTRARNYCVQKFLDSGFSHMIFIDSDINFNPIDVLKMLSYGDKDIICGPYSKKVIRWDRVSQAYSKGLMTLQSDPNLAEFFSGDFVFNFAPEVKKMRIDEPVSVLEAGTGFMLIRRETFEKYAEAYPELKYDGAHIRNNQKWEGEMVAYFDTVIDPETRRYLSEDFMFCKYARAIGMKVWLCPWVKLKHIGNHVYEGNFISTIDLLF